MRKKTQVEKPVNFNKVCDRLFKLSDKLTKIDQEIHEILDFILKVKKPKKVIR